MNLSLPPTVGGGGGCQFVNGQMRKSNPLLWKNVTERKKDEKYVKIIDVYNIFIFSAKEKKKRH